MEENTLVLIFWYFYFFKSYLIYTYLIEITDYFIKCLSHYGGTVNIFIVLEKTTLSKAVTFK